MASHRGSHGEGCCRLAALAKPEQDCKDLDITAANAENMGS